MHSFNCNISNFMLKKNYKTNILNVKMIMGWGSMKTEMSSILSSKVG